MHKLNSSVEGEKQKKHTPQKLPPRSCAARATAPPHHQSCLGMLVDHGLGRFLCLALLPRMLLLSVGEVSGGVCCRSFANVSNGGRQDVGMRARARTDETLKKTNSFFHLPVVLSVICSLVNNFFTYGGIKGNMWFGGRTYRFKKILDERTTEILRSLLLGRYR
jgi:hypothetical protein